MKRALLWLLLAWLLALVAGCGAVPVDFGVTASSRPQVSVQLCVMAAEPFVAINPALRARCYGWARGNVLLGASTQSAYGRGAVS